MENTLSTGKAARLLGISVKTLQRWEREGRLIPAARSPSNRRLYTERQLRECIGLRYAGGMPTCYRRVYDLTSSNTDTSPVTLKESSACKPHRDNGGS